MEETILRIAPGAVLGSELANGVGPLYSQAVGAAAHRPKSLISLVVVHLAWAVLRSAPAAAAQAVPRETLQIQGVEMSLSKKSARILLTAGVTGALSLAATSSMAVVFPDFSVNEGSVSGALPLIVNADKITGNYDEIITFTGAGTFDVSLIWNAGQFVANNGATPVSSQLGSTFPQQYGLYALYQGSGTFSSVGAVTTFTTTAGAGSLNVYIDPDSNTTFTAPATGLLAWTTGNAGLDYLIATGTPQAGAGTLDPSLSTCGGVGQGINCGSFGTSSTFALQNPLGSNYFFLPNPFYSVSFQSGQLNNFTPTGTVDINGSMDVVFAAVPEPATLALVGLGLIGVGVSRRKRV